MTGPTWNFPGAYSLELGYAERFEEYDGFGQPVERPKFSVRWQPIDNALTLRAAYMEAFHAPGVNELFGGAAQSFTAISDPASLAAGENQPETFFRSNPTLKPEEAYEYTYGGVLTPGKWWAPLQGLTLSADFVHIDLRDYAAALDPQALVNLANQGRLPTYYDVPGPLTQQWVLRPSGGGLILEINDPLSNLGRFTISSWDFEEVYTLDTSRFGHGDWGTLTETLNWTYLADADVQLIPNGKRRTIAGQYGSGFQGPSGVASFPRDKAYMSVYYDGPNGTWAQGLDAGVTVHFISQYWDLESATTIGVDGWENCSSAGLAPCDTDRKIREWFTLDLIINYTFNLPPPAAQNEVAGYAKDGGKNVKMKDGKEKNVMPVSTAEYNPCGWRAWFNNMTLTLGMQNVFDSEPPFVAGDSFADVQGYDQGQANNKGRVWYVAIKKRF